MARRHAKTKAYVEAYAKACEVHNASARIIESLIREILADPPLEIHQISCRPKSIESVRLKLLEKRYKNPGRELTDALGVRVITYYSQDVDTVVDKLRESLKIDEKNSGDKRKALTLKEFGYKSVHLQAQTKRSWASNPKYSQIRNKWFEIQVRSILEHAWAEIEHEIIYKSGVVYPPEIKRKFARLAGAIEILDEEFVDLRHEKDVVIDRYVKEFKKHHVRQVSLDVAQMIALMEVDMPNLRGWRSAERQGEPFELKSDLACKNAIRAAGVKSPRKLRGVLRSARFRNALVKIENELEEITHYTALLIAVAIKSEKAFRDYFPSSKIQALIDA
jgi:ppGpp synthetase/RelA/SpoT-type nucleotidyltranferase